MCSVRDSPRPPQTHAPFIFMAGGRPTPLASAPKGEMERLTAPRRARLNIALGLCFVLLVKEKSSATMLLM